MLRSSKSIARMLALALLTFCFFAGAESLSPEQESALRDIARGEATVWPGLSPEQILAIQEKAESYFERYQRQHLPHGLNADLIWTDRGRAQLAEYKGLGDGAIWTGHYLASLAFRYHLDPAPSTRDAILETLDAIDRLTLVSGREGYIARYAGPADDPVYAEYYRQSGGTDWFRPGLGRNAYRGTSPYDDFVWLGDSSRDVYDGIQFGLAALWIYVEDEEVRARVKAIVRRVGRRLENDSFVIWDGGFNITLPSLYSYPVWPLLMVSVCPEDFSSVRFNYQVGSFLYRVCARYWGLNIRTEHDRQYYPNNLNLIRLFTLCQLEDCPERKAEYQDILRNACHGELSNHLNAHFAAIYLLCTGDDDPGAVATLQGSLLDFPEEKWEMPVDHRGEVEMLDADYARYALLPSERPMRDFLWQRPPALAHGGSGEPIEYPGIDMFLPYWMARVAGVLPNGGF